MSVKCKYCEKTNEEITGWFWDDGSGCCEDDFICTKCMNKITKGYIPEVKDENTFN